MSSSPSRDENGIEEQSAAFCLTVTVNSWVQSGGQTDYKCEYTQLLMLTRATRRERSTEGPFIIYTPYHKIVGPRDVCFLLKRAINSFSSDTKMTLPIFSGEYINF